MKKYLLHFTIAACMLIGLSACYRDLGNYNYKDPNTVTIGGIDDKYSVMQGNYFQILPQLSATDPTANDSARYTYEWIGMKSGALVADKKFDLGKNRNLRMNVNIPAGIYYIYYRVKDTLTGVQFQKSFSIEVTSTIYEGWLLMTEVNGGARADMISKVNNQYTVIQDVLGTVGSALKLQGKPVAVSCSVFSSLTGGYAIYFSTDKTANKVDPETFQYKSTMNIKYEVLSSIPETFSPFSIVDPSPGNLRIYMQESDDVYFYDYIRQVKFGIPINLLKGETNTFHAAPFIAASSLAEVAVLYDNDNKRFLRHSNYDASCTLMPDGTLFNYTTGMDLVYMTFSVFNSGNVFAILKDPATQKYYLARFTIGSNTQQVYYDEMTATDISIAKNFAVSPDLGYIFYTVGGKLYSYDMSQKASKLMISLTGNQTFTLLKFRDNTLMAATYDPSQPEGSNGTLTAYTVAPVQGDLVVQNSWPGLGKIVSIAYRKR